MEKHRAIPKGYMTVGEIAKKMGVTVRTLQYYDKEGILSPSLESEGGRRLYTHKDIIKLHQIQSMKYLGFSLEDIKTRIPSINTPQEVSSALMEQATGIREKIESLKNVLESVEKLNAEVVQMKSVDWEKYADIIFILQAKNEAHWVIKHLNGSVVNHLRNRFTDSHFDKKSDERILDSLKWLIQKAAKLQKNGYIPDSEQGQALAKDWWDFVIDTTGGNIDLMTEIFKLSNKFNEDEWKENFFFDKDFIGKALECYCASIGYSLSKLREDKE